MTVRWLKQKWRTLYSSCTILRGRRGFRSDAALEAIAKAGEDRVQNLALYNYPSFSGAFSALFAHLFHSHLNLPCLILPFSSVEPFRLQHLTIDGLLFFLFTTYFCISFIYVRTLVAATVKT